jgi:hypothetical protein
MPFKETIDVENHMEHTNILCDQNVELYYVKDGGSYINLWALKGE